MLTDYFERIYNGKPQRLLKALNFIYHELSHRELMKLLRSKRVSVNGEKADLDSVVKEGDILNLYYPTSATIVKSLYSDDNIFAAFKPRGVISDGTHSFEGLVKYKYGANYTLLHRLDTNTEGILIFSKNDTVHDLLVNATKRGQIEKYYLAQVNGIIKENITLDGYLVKDSEKSIVKIYKQPKANSFYVKCFVSIIDYDKDSTHIEVMIKEGKTHQIRAQLAEYGHFVLGDSKYGRDSINRKYNYKKQQLTAHKIIFKLDKHNPLKYLNNIKIKL